MIIRTAVLAATLLTSAHAARAVLVESEVPATAITATASSTFSPQQDVRHLLDGSGLAGDRHDDEGGARTMWHTAGASAATAPAAGLSASPAWVRFDFAAPQPLTSVRIWNHNQAWLTDRGFRQAHLFRSSDGATWQAQALELPRGDGTAVSVPLAAGPPVVAVVIAAASSYGSDYYGLSEVRFMTGREVAEKDLPFPSGLECQVRPYYCHRPDGRAGRAITLNLAGAKLYGEATVETMGETTRFHDLKGASQLTVLLPAGVSVSNACEARLTLRQGGRALDAMVAVSALRQWTVYIYPHSHVDIGYTNMQKNVEEIHKRNLLNGIALALQTAGYPDGARYLWNPEVIWPVERYLQTASPAEREHILDAVRRGYLRLDAGYINDNTSVAADEEFDGFFGPAKRLETLTGVKVDTLVQVDVAGMSWGIVPAAAQAGIRYCLVFNNGTGRVGHSMELAHRPFWWIGPDGQSKILFLQPGSYTPGVQAKGGQFWPLMAGQTDPDKLLRIVKTDNPRANFIDGYLWPTLARLGKSDFYPYDIFPMSWALADNTPIDADLPDAVKSWNEEYAFPHLVIASAHEIMSTFEKKYGDQLPTRRGDFTEYWTDGLGSAARQASMNRAAKERLIQTDTLWSMLRPGDPAPRAEFDEAWRYVVLASEHTWCFMDPNQQPIQNDIMKVKFSYFQEAEDRSKALLAQALRPFSAPTSTAIAVFNTLSWGRTGLVTVKAAGQRVLDDAGREVPSQLLTSGDLAFLASDVPALGSRTYRLTAGQPRAAYAGCTVTGDTLDNGLVKVALNPQTGDIASLLAGGHEYVDAKSPYALNSYRYLHGADNPEKATGPSDILIKGKENGPLVVSLVVESQAEGCTRLTREVRLVAGRPHVEIVNTVDKIATKKKEGIHFGFAFNIPDPRTRADIPWGVMEVEADQFPEGNRNWICFQRWLDISGADYGVTWCSLDSPNFEHGRIAGNILGDATDSSAWLRQLPPSATIFSWALNNHWHTNFPLEQEGQIPFRYSILPHGTGYDAAQANRFGLDQAQPLIASPVAGPLAVAPQVALDNPRVFVSSLKTSADGKSTSLRLRSLSDRPETVQLARPTGPGQRVELLPFGIVTLEQGN